jgi:hypothetical protein
MKVTVLLVVRTVMGVLDPSTNVPPGYASWFLAELL